MPLMTFARRSAMLIAAIVALVMSAAPVASAAPAPSPSTIGISPVGTTASYFTVNMTAGTSRQLAVEYSDHGTAAAQASTYAADVYTIVNGGFGAGLRNQPTTAVTNWLTYPATTISLKAGMVQRRTFTVTVPANTAPGEHVTSLIVQYQTRATTGGPVSLSQVSRQALPIVIVVPGPITPGLAIGAATQATVDGRTDVSVGVTNTGNVRLRPAGRLVVTNDHGAQVATVNVKMGTVYPGDTTSTRALLANLLPPGRYTVTAELADTALGLSARQANVGLDVPAMPRVQAISPTTTLPGTPRPAAAAGHIPVELIVGLVMASLLAGAAGTYGLAARRRRKVKSRIVYRRPKEAGATNHHAQSRSR